MTPPLFLAPAAAGLPGSEFLLDGDEGHHAARVARVRAGETVLVGDGDGTLAHCTVIAVDGGAVRLLVDSNEVVPAPSPRLVVVQALPKGERAELAVETMTELGVDVIVPWAASRSVVQWSGARGEKALEKWRRTAREAAKQSRRPRVPEVAELAATRAVAGLLGGASCALVLHEAATSPLASVELPGDGDVVLVVGPEGGVATDELDQFVEAGAAPVLLGREVLRTSTAGAAALAAMSVRLGRWG